MNFSELYGEEFEQLCARLLQAEGYTLKKQEPKSRDIGVDFSFMAPDEKAWVAEVKHFRRPRTGTTVLREASVQLNSAKQLIGANNALLIVSMLLPAELKHDLEQKEEIIVWDGRILRELLQSHPKIESDFEKLIQARHIARKGAEEQEPAIELRGQELIERLDSLPTGRSHWRQYEDLCVEILNYVFYPELGVPAVQDRSEDGLDIRDAVFPIKSSSVFWQEIRQSTLSRFMVAEFKNYSEGIGQREVESIQQYLYTKAMRMFGLVCSRKQPRGAAWTARRRAWVEADKMILLLSDEEMKDLICAKSFGEKPTDVLDAQLEEFLLRLSP